jgi:hypothetical protein
MGIDTVRLSSNSRKTWQRRLSGKEGSDGYDENTFELNCEMKDAAGEPYICNCM